MNATDELIHEIEGAARDARAELGFEPLVRISVRSIEVVLIALVKRLDKRFSFQGATMRPFPTQAETFESAGVLLTLIRGGSPDYKPGDYVHAGLCVADFATQQIMQTSGDVHTAQDYDVKNSVEQTALLAALQSYCAPGNVSTQVALNWKQLLQLAWQLLKPILDDLLKGQPA